MSFYEYYEATDHTHTNITWTGQPNAGRTAVIQGTKQVHVTRPNGQTWLMATTDVATGAVLQQDTYSQFDAYERPSVVTHLDGSTESTVYSCCGVESTTDRDGVTTSYGYDAMKRPVSVTRLGITTWTQYDAMGHVLKTWRTGTDNSTVVLSQLGYDTAGRLVAETNALGGVTQYSETVDPSTMGRVRTTIYPDGGTRIENYYRDGKLKSVTGAASHGTRYERTSDGMYPMDKEVKLNLDGTDSGEWVGNITDGVGRNIGTRYSDSSLSQTFYNNKGLLEREVDPDGVTTLYAYNDKGELAYTAQDINGNQQIDFAGTDRVSASLSDIYNDSGTFVRRTRSYAWNTMGVNQSNLVSESKATLDGRRSWQTVFKNSTSGLTNWSATAWTTNGYRYVTNGAPDGSTSLATYYMGRLTSTVRKDGLGTILSSTTYTYDSHGRQASVVDARSGATTYAYNAADLMASVTTPAPSFAAGPQTTRTWYNKMLQATNVVQPDGSSVFTEYYLTGELKRNYGSRTYPVDYTYDYAGRMKTMTTWKDFESSYGAAVTTWDYDSVRGWLSGKRYNDDSGPLYTYTLGGRLKTRTWARGVVTTYTYGFDDWDYDSIHGDLLSVEYSNDPLMTPAVAYTYDRAGRQSTVTQDATVVTFGYSTTGGLLTETYSGGPLNGLSITNGYDHLLRRTNLTLRSGSAVLSATAYSYDMASRLSSVSQPSTLNFQPVTATYSYLANTPLVSQILFTNNGARRMTTTRTYDLANRLLKIESFNAQPSTLSSFNYDYNAANQRTLRREADGSYWRYEYDSLGQVISGKKYWSDGTPVPGQQFEYAFDDIGNRTGTKTGGDANGANLRNAGYSANLLNQYTSRTVPGVVDVMGVGFATNTVTVNSQATYRKGEYFRKEVSVGNSSTPVWQSITVSAAGQTNIVGNVLVPRANESFCHDSDGNLLSDSLWTNTWNSENRLVEVESAVTVPGQARMREEWTHLPDGRWIQRIVSTNSGGVYYPAYTNRFVWDRQVLLAILDHTNGVVASFMRGSDLSGSIQGAGGVGGVLAVNFGLSTLNTQPSTPSQPSTHMVSYDGNGNVVALHNAADGSESAAYEYGPFSEPIRVTGPAASLMPLRFSTMYEDNVTGDRKYLFRDYTPSTGRWKSRDPIEGPNLFALTANDALTSVDFLGLSALETIVKKLKDERDLFVGVSSVEKTSFTYAVKLFYAMRFLIGARYGKLEEHVAAKWMRDENKMVLDGDLMSPGTLVHEMTHAYNDLVAGLSDYSDFRKDEGMGYAMQSFEELARTLVNGEVSLRSHPCDYDRAKQIWQALWKNYGVIPSVAWGTGAAWGQFQVGMADLENIRNAFGVHLSCREIADAFNSILASTDCCLRVKCSGPDTGYDIGPGAVIVPIFE
jgi:RHS repeat-associated protein